MRGWKMLRFFSILTLVVLVGCEAQPVKFTGPDGGDAYSVSCFRTLVSCYKQAAEKCQGKYKILDGTTAVSLGGTQRNNLVFSCNS